MEIKQPSEPRDKLQNALHEPNKIWTLFSFSLYECREDYTYTSSDFDAERKGKSILTDEIWEASNQTEIFKHKITRMWQQCQF